MASDLRFTEANGRTSQAIGAAPDALRMQRVVSFYEKLPRGAIPEVKAKGILGRYQARYFGKNASVTRTIFRLSSSEISECQRPMLTFTFYSHHSHPGIPDRYRVCSELLLPPAYVSASSNGRGALANSDTGHHKNNAH